MNEVKTAPDMHALISMIITSTRRQIEFVTGNKVKVSWKELSIDKTVEYNQEQYDFFMECCEALDVLPETVGKRIREKEYVAMRQSIVVAMRQRFKKDISYKYLGQLVNLNDHTTVIHNYLTGMTHRKNKDSEFMRYFKKLEHLLHETENSN